jgi:F-type H+-transporting ATPase subunit b
MLDLQLPTIAFQVLNFLVLLAILARFFYRPLLRVMTERENAIAARLREADERTKQAEAERQRLASLQREAEAQAEAQLAAARTEAQAVGKQILDGARQEAARMLDEARHTVDEREKAALARVEARARDSAVRMTGSLIRRTAGPAVHEALLERICDQGEWAGATEAESLREAVGNGQASVVVEVAYPATAETEARLREAVARLLSGSPRPIDLTLQVDPALVAGLRVQAGDVVLDMSLSRTLRELDEAPAESAAVAAS